MFTGIIHHIAKISDVHREGDGMRLRIDTQFSDLSLGESIAVNGICLTVTATENDRFICELSPETLSLTTAKQYQVGQLVNVERALQLQDRLGGHYVTGHVDGVLLVKSVEKVEDFVKISFANSQTNARRFLVKKGSVGINGVSLTVNEVSEHDFSVMLIPHTLKMTNLKHLQAGQLVNVEYDQMAKWVSHYVELYASNYVIPAKAGI